MSSRSTQISATVSKETKKLLDAFVRRRGIKKSFVIEEALRRHMLAADEIPEEFLIPPVVRLTRQSMQKLADLLESPPPPTEPMQTLMRGEK